jgi:hypothetical protein
MIVWEYGHTFADGPERDAMRDMVGGLSALGFHNLLPCVDEFHPFDADGRYTGNVVTTAARIDQFL